MVSLVWVARMARQVAMQARGQDGRVFLEMDRLREGHLTFMAAAHYTINRLSLIHISEPTRPP